MGKSRTFEVGSPRQIFDQLGRFIDQRVVLQAPLLVDDGDESLPLRATTEGVHVALDKAEVVLDGRSLILDPLARAVLREEKRKQSIDAPLAEIRRTLCASTSPVLKLSS